MNELHETFTALLCSVVHGERQSRPSLYVGDPAGEKYRQCEKSQAGQIHRRRPSNVRSTAANNPPPDPVLEATLRNIAGLRADFETLGPADTNSASLKTT